MRFTPKSESEIQRSNLIDAGVYNFQVIAAKDTVSKNGNEMIELQLNVWDMNGREHFIYDYLLEAMSFKLRHFAESTGLLGRYEAGELVANDCIGKSGNVEISIQAGRPNPNGGTYPDKNSVKDYIVKSESDKPICIDDIPFNDDSIPF